MGYLGPAHLPDADYALYGSVSFTNVKFLIVLQDNYEPRNDDRISAVICK